MAADLQIHAFVDGELSTGDFKDFFSCTLGSKWFGGFGQRQDHDAFMRGYSKFSALPSVHVGEVSWLKASITEDKSFVPDPVRAVTEIIDDSYPVIDEDLIGRIEAALTRKNESQYGVSSAEPVVKFLRQHMGKRAICISW